MLSNIFAFVVLHPSSVNAPEREKGLKVSQAYPRTNQQVVLAVEFVSPLILRAIC